ncbi:MAG: alpha-galactosidase [Anaerolineae bacterium]|nr:alpha-galactosidase [Anaerolineae bacterium]
MTSCRARREGELLVLENDRIKRTFLWNDGHLIGQEVVDLVGGHAWTLTGAAPDVDLSGAAAPAPGEGALALLDRPATAYTPAHLQVDVTARLGALHVRRRFRIYPGCPAMACDLHLRGEGTDLWGGETTLDRLCLPQPHLRLDCVRFYDVTDRRNTLVTRQAALPYRHEGRLAGNLLLIRDPAAGQGLFLLKEAPCSDVQLAWPGYDFAHRIGEIRVAGVGLVPTDLDAEAWMRGYGSVLGVAPCTTGTDDPGAELGLLAALRTYQRQIRTHAPDRDEMVLLNTWGDRGQDTRIGADFALAELERGARLGISHFQLDDGWQAGRTSNSAFAGGSLSGIWDDAGFWSPHPARFPEGLGPVAARARALGIELCVWFNPSADDSYAHWKADADVLIGLYRAHGIRTYKIDGILLPDKRADRNLRAMFERVMAATEGQAVFNLDVTAGRRWGYHYGNAYGNIFLENRYTDWSNYYPHWTLRNLWMLSPYVPAQNLQIEFLNKWRNADRYPAGDPLAPARVPFDYCFAVTMAAQPLAWFEATGLPEEAFAIAPLVRTYRAHQARLHEGLILPVGEEPSGFSWTGFQSLRGDAGYLIVYREWTERAHARLRLWGLAGRQVEATCVAGYGRDFTAQVGADGELEVHLPAPFTFALYAYQAK